MRGLLKLGVGPVWGRLLSSLLAPGVPGPAAPAARLAGAPVSCKSRLSVSVVVKASTVSFLDHEGQKQKNTKKSQNKKQNKKRCSDPSSKTANQTEKHPPRPSPRAREPSHHSEGAGPRPPAAGSALAGGRREGRDSVFYHVFLPGPTRGSVGQRRAAAGPSRRSGQQDSTLAADCASGGTAGRGAGTGAAFHLGASAVPSHPVSCALGPGYPSCRAANTCVLRTWGGVCSHWRLSNQQPWGPTSTPRADMFPELQGTQAPSLHMRGLWLPSQG